MADDAPDAESKTEDPTPKRREEARRRGQVPFSAEVVGSGVLFAGIMGLSYIGPGLWETMTGVFKSDLSPLIKGDFSTDAIHVVFLRIVVQVLGALLPLMGIMLAVGVGTSVAQVGFEITTEKLEIDFDRINPANGLSRLFSVSALVKGMLAFVKIAAIFNIAYVILNPRIAVILQLGRQQPTASSMAAWAIIMRLAIALTASIVGVAVLDYLYQRYKFEQSLKMTKQELKDEAKQEDGDPQIKARMRQMARERAKKRMIAEVPKATVVITNPTHYAVALRYRPPEDASPTLVAKGAGVFAKQIALLARQNGIPVLERPPLTRALYASVKEGRTIPTSLFRAVAEVIAFVYQLRGIAPQKNDEAN